MGHPGRSSILEHRRENSVHVEMRPVSAGQPASGCEQGANPSNTALPSLFPIPSLSCHQGRCGCQGKTEDRVSGKSQVLPSVKLPFLEPIPVHELSSRRHAACGDLD